MRCDEIFVFHDEDAETAKIRFAGHVKGILRQIPLAGASVLARADAERELQPTFSSARANDNLPDPGEGDAPRSSSQAAQRLLQNACPVRHEANDVERLADHDDDPRDDALGVGLLAFVWKEKTQDAALFLTTFASLGIEILFATFGNLNTHEGEPRRFLFS
jgi:hypothetical protein